VHSEGQYYGKRHEVSSSTSDIPIFFVAALNRERAGDPSHPEILGDMSDEIQAASDQLS